MSTSLSNPEVGGIIDDVDAGRRVQRSDFDDLTRISTPRMIPPPQRVWTADEWQVILRGYAAQDMDHRWHAFVERDRLYLHRSWTGLGIYEAQFQSAGGNRRISEAVVLADDNAYARGSDEYETLMLEALISSDLLHSESEELWSRLSDLRRTELLKLEPAEDAADEVEADAPDIEDVEDIVEHFWDELNPGKWEVASFRTDYGSDIVGVAEVEGWLIPFSIGSDTGGYTLGAWRADEPGARTAALEACLNECGAAIGFRIGPELRVLKERDGDAPWMNGELTDLLANYKPNKLARALEDDCDVGVLIEDVPKATELIARLKKGGSPNTAAEQSFAWDLTSTLGMAEHHGRLIGE